MKSFVSSGFRACFFGKLMLRCFIRKIGKRENAKKETPVFEALPERDGQVEAFREEKTKGNTPEQTD